MRQGLLKLEPSAAHILQVALQQAHDRIRIDCYTRLLDLLLIHQHFAREDERLSALARRHQPSLYQQFVEPHLHSIPAFTR